MEKIFWDSTLIKNAPKIGIIGSGITGLSAALSLYELNPNLRIEVLEKHERPFGASVRNAGFSCFGSLSELFSDSKHMDENEIYSLVEKRYLGIQKLLGRVSHSDICYEAVGGYEVFDDSENIELLEKIPFYNKLLFPIFKKDFFKDQTHQFKNFGLKNFSSIIKQQEEGLINPQKMIRALIYNCKSKGITFKYNYDVKEIQDNLVITTDGWEKYDGIIVANNAMASEWFPQFSIQPVRNQVYVTTPLTCNLKAGGYHYDQGYIYFRNVEGNRILIGGARNKFPNTESTHQFGTTLEIKNYLLQFLKNHLVCKSNITFEFEWSGILGVGPVKAPVIQPVNPFTIAAVRMGGMGVALGTNVGEQAAAKLIELLDK